MFKVRTVIVAWEYGPESTELPYIMCICNVFNLVTTSASSWEFSYSV